MRKIEAITAPPEPIVRPIMQHPGGYRFYYSDRGIPLVRIARPNGIPVVTVENYIKWYNLFIIMPDETVCIIDDQRFDDIWSDHVPNPTALMTLINEAGWEMDETSLDMIYGRFHMERK